MTHPTMPKRYSLEAWYDSPMCGKPFEDWHGPQAGTKEDVYGHLCEYEEALTYANAIAKQARLDALEEVKAFVKRQQDFRKTVPNNSKRLNDDGEILQETMDEIDKLKEGV